MKRFAVIAAFAALAAGVVVMPGSAASFDDSNPCPAQGPLLVCPATYVGKSVNLQLRALAGCDLYRWEITNGSLPKGLTMNSDGLITGAAKSAEETHPWVTVHDRLPSEGGNSWCIGDNHSERQFVFKTLPGLEIQNQPIPQATTGQPYSYTLTVVSVTSTDPFAGSPTTANWSWSGSLPPGLSLSQSGVLSGTPTSDGAYTFTLKAEGGGGATNTKTETLSVRQPMAVTSPFTTGAVAQKLEVGVPFTATQTATGGSGTYKWTVASGTPPAGVVLNPDNGTLTGTPTTPGVSTFTIRVADTEGRSQDLKATLVVADRLAVTPAKLKSAIAGRGYRERLLKTGGVAPLEWKLVRGKLPKGVTLAKKLGLLLGKPTKAGNYRFTVEAVDALGVKSSANFTLAVKSTAGGKKR